MANKSTTTAKFGRDSKTGSFLTKTGRYMSVKEAKRHQRMAIVAATLREMKGGKFRVMEKENLHARKIILTVPIWS